MPRARRLAHQPLQPTRNPTPYGRGMTTARGGGLQKCPCSVCKANPRNPFQTRNNVWKHVNKDEERQREARRLGQPSRNLNTNGTPASQFPGDVPEPTDGQ